MWASRGMGWWKRQHAGPKTWTVSSYSFPNTIHSAAHTPTARFQRNPFCGTRPGKKFIASVHVPFKIILFSWLEYCPFYPFFFRASPDSIWLPFPCCLSVTIIILLIAPSSAADTVTATSSITELTGSAVTKKASSLLEISWTSRAKSDLTPMKEAFHGLWQLVMDFLLFIKVFHGIWESLYGKSSSALKYETPPDPLSKNAYLPFQLWRTGWGTGWKKESIYPWCYCSPSLCSHCKGILFPHPIIKTQSTFPSHQGI